MDEFVKADKFVYINYLSQPMRSWMDKNVEWLVLNGP